MAFWDRAAGRPEMRETGPESRAPIVGSGAPVAVAWSWFPAGEYEQALRQWPELVDLWGLPTGHDHAAYCRMMQAKLEEAARSGLTNIWIAPIQITALVAWANERGEDPASASARSAYAADLARRGDPDLIAWPPERNQSCWCGSGRKYKACCARPITARG
ncbi:MULTISPECIES: SEC-C domain-containing protein [unclassified Crossiella]|uniref:SEC-C domain-containing protein n=1 Tax=unclassified Crossiella TaxID=2620835 RepID=UPI0020001BBD|nr:MULTISPECIES: SEC-C domain-containing protein [unclassified Crossiella]MCK2240970.1 SEC-C domain-containing protein [Crossiella sp. S99.2]MCK2253886.1 SEC-C domain-containing protein [Crossiella sp. S99.1]